MKVENAEQPLLDLETPSRKRNPLKSNLPSKNI